MSFIDRANGMRPNFTKTDQQIADYIMANSNEVLSLSVAELSRATNTSPAAIIRFVKKLRYDSLRALRCDLAVELSKNESESQSLLIHKNDSLNVISNKLVYLCQKVSCTTQELLDIPTLESAIQAMKKADNIYLFGVGASAVVATDLMTKLCRIGKHCFFQHDSSTQVASSVHITKKDVAIGLSYSGETKAVTLGLQQAKANGAFCIALTSTQTNSLYSLADVILQIPHIESKIRIGAIGSRYGMFFLADLLFLGTTQSTNTSVEDYLSETYNLTRKLCQ